MNFPVPEYNQDPLYVRQFLSMVHFGSYLQYHDTIAGDIRIGRLLRRSQAPGLVYMNRYDEFNNADVVTADMQNLQEIQQTGDEVLVPTIQITEIAIVLSPHDIVTMKLTITSDFTNAFLLRFNTDNQPVNSHVAYPCSLVNEVHSSVHCLLKSIIICLRDIRSSIHKMLNKVSSATSDFNRDTKHTPLCIHGWNYVRRNLHPFSIHDSYKSHGRIGVFGTRLRQRIHRTCFLIRSETICQLESLNFLVGGGILIGVREKPPPAGKLPIHNQPGDILNIVPGNDDITDNHKRRIFGFERSGIDLIYYGDNSIDISVRYNRHVYESNSVLLGRLIAAPVNNNVVNEPDNNIGRLFIHNGEAYIVYREFVQHNVPFVGARLVNGGDEFDIAVDIITFINLD